MEFVAVGLALTCVGLALKLMTMKSALTKASLLLERERELSQISIEKYEDLKLSADKRIKQLKVRNNELLELTIKDSAPGALLDNLNSLLEDEDS